MQLTSSAEAAEAVDIPTEGIREATQVSGWLFENTTWGPSIGPYAITSTVTVLEGVTLVIEPGTVIKGQGIIDVHGTLIAGASESDPVIFSSWNDDAAFGDMNDYDEDGQTELEPVPGEGPMLIARSGGAISLQNVDMRYGGGNGWAVYENPPPDVSGSEVAARVGPIVNDGGRVTVSDSVFTFPRVNTLMHLRGETGIKASRLSGGANGVRALSEGVSIQGSSLTDMSEYAILEDGFPVMAEHNWWGDPSGPRNAGTNPNGTGFSVSSVVSTLPWLTHDPFNSEVPAACLTECVSNVLFLPGIKGSRLYDGSGQKLWEPFGNHDIESLLLDTKGKSIHAEVHTKPGAVVDSVALFMDIYDSYMAFMDELVENKVLNEWQQAPYDWRLSLPDIVHGGSETNGRISFTGETSEPYLQKTLEELAATSKSGKVTIVAHSNGGLVAKELMLALGEEETGRLIDEVIFVGVPQSGAPQAVGALLYGYREGLPWWFPGIVSTATARTFAENSPMGYQLLPSATYFDSVQDSNHSVVSFETGTAYEKERVTYGVTVDTFEELGSFALAQEGGRTKPLATHIHQANILNASLIAYGRDVHERLDAWTPPKNVTVHQIAGWGEDTVAGIEYYELCVLSLCVPKYRPTFVEDGDGVVPVPSAVMMPDAENVKRYWIDLQKLGFGPFGSKNHGNIMGAAILQELVEVILRKDSSSTPQGIFTEEIAGTNPTKKLRFFLHSPLSLELFDEFGNRVGPNEDGTHDEHVLDSRYGQFGEVQYLTVPAGPKYRLELHAYDSGTFSLEVEEISGNKTTASATFVEVPVTPETIATLEIASDMESLGGLHVDTDGDGVIDTSLNGTLREMAEQPNANSASRASRSSPRPTEPLVLGTYTEETVEYLSLKVYALLLQLLLELLQRDENFPTQTIE